MVASYIFWPLHFGNQGVGPAITQSNRDGYTFNSISTILYQTLQAFDIYTTLLRIQYLIYWLRKNSKKKSYIPYKKVKKIF